VPYSNGDSKAREPQTIGAPIPEAGWHWTRDLVFSPDGTTLYVSVGSASDHAERGMASEADRASILAFNPMALASGASQAVSAIPSG
jgi:glucose/arabinose dehydrogenase